MTDTHLVYDYIMNTRRAYNLLGEAVHLAERLAKRMGRTLEHTVSLAPWQELSIRRWWRRAKEAIVAAENDFQKNFHEALLDDGTIDINELMSMAVSQRDRW